MDRGDRAKFSEASPGRGVAKDDLVMEGRRRWCSMPMGRVLGSRGGVEIGARQRERIGSSGDLFIGDWGNERGWSG
jgi:hypothetical protein